MKKLKNKIRIFVIILMIVNLHVFLIGCDDPPPRPNEIRKNAQKPDPGPQDPEQPAPEKEDPLKKYVEAIPQIQRNFAPILERYLDLARERFDSNEENDIKFACRVIDKVQIIIDYEREVSDDDTIAEEYNDESFDLMLKYCVKPTSGAEDE